MLDPILQLQPNPSVDLLLLKFDDENFEKKYASTALQLENSILKHGEIIYSIGYNYNLSFLNLSNS